MVTNPNFEYYDVEKFSSIREMMELAADHAGDRTAFKYRLGKNQPDIDVSYREFYEDTQALGAKLLAEGFGGTPDSHIGCLGANSYPWVVVYLTALQSAGVFVPIDRELPDKDILNILLEGDVNILFCDKKFLQTVKDHRDSLPQLQRIVCLDQLEPFDDTPIYSDWVKAGHELDKSDFQALKREPNALADLVYTSGTTGRAKGVMLSEENLVASVYYGLQVSTVFTRSLSVLPYHHTYEAVSGLLVSIHKRVTICINDSLFNVANHLKWYKPDFIYLVPAFAELFYSRIMAGIKKQGKEKSFKLLMKVSGGLRKIGIDLRPKLFKPVLETFGGNMRKLVCGGAPIRPEIGRFFDAIGLSLIGGYGITECSPLVSVNPDSFNDWNTAGCRLACVDWKIHEPNEEGIGEIVVKGDIVMQGYYKRPDLTAEVLIDGWFFTGDYGYLTPKDQLVITGRKKNIIVLDNGKNIYPEEIEGELMAIPYIKEIMVSGVANPETGQVGGLQAEIYLDKEATVDEKEILKDIRETLKDLPSYKQVLQVTCRDTEFKKTTTNKIIR